MSRVCLVRLPLIKREPNAHIKASTIRYLKRSVAALEDELYERTESPAQATRLSEKIAVACDRLFELEGAE